ncbi:putative O-linked N-acetylglucosamine transferase (SPINDLY family) [Thiocapsa rosea]|uniref:protein O-GlcNAc transferase n=2 Tax=Thiocapsa rosea TaxID=69360 RepID=A0A495V7I6_9GAMM|nr:putative O-linked N-acetylglucosamine transferase (SPINDLY family) [Thiocapsa rosea]
MRKVLESDPDAPDALLILGLLAAGEQRFDEAEVLLRRCVAAAPGYMHAYNNLGNVLMARRRYADAQVCYADAARLAPNNPMPHFNLGNCLREQGRFSGAEDAYRKALALAPDYVDARVNLGNVLREQGFYAEAESLYSDLLAHHPELHEVRLNLGNLYRLTGQLDRAREQYEALLSVQPGHSRAELSRALVLLAERDLEGAEHLIMQVQRAGDTTSHEVLAALCALRMRQGDNAAALEAAMASIAAGGETPVHYLLVAEMLHEIGRRREAMDVLERSRARFGERPRQWSGAMLKNQRQLCDWRGWEDRVPALVQRLRGSDPDAVGSFESLSLPGLAPADLLAVARAYGERFRSWMERGPLSSATAGRDLGGRRLRIGYLSGDFHEHATAYLTASVFEMHDRDRFEVFAYSIGPADRSAMRLRLMAAFEHFEDIRNLGHLDAARRIAADGIDILVDLKGYTRDARPEILALRPAPIQVNWLGFPGSMGVPFVDYLIVDPVVVPPEEALCYEEALAYLPDSYQPTDPRRKVAPAVSRSEACLPDDCFVFCCFNNPFKLNPEVFGVWCGLLRDVPNSVLWLYADDDDVRANLSREVAARGLSVERLIFAGKMPQAEHMARVALADLFLDTWPYNAHTTASDALWAGVPVLTCMGGTFPSRVAASVLSAAGVKELITADPGEYRALALRLARSPEILAGFRMRLSAARAVAALFDPARFTNSLEDLYGRMWARHAEGLRPELLAFETG